MANPGKLRVVTRAGVGVDNVDLDAATKNGILVMNTPDANTISTAEQTMSLMLGMSRHVAAADAHVRSGEWKRKQYMGTQLAGKTLGLVGFGRIGRAVAVRALSFDMKVLAYDPFISGDTALEGQVTMVETLGDLLGKVDYLSLHTVVNEDTEKMINADSIAKMKDGVRIVNCARGKLINEADLAEALKSGKVAAAAVDVYSSEPPGEDNPLLAAPNLTLAPHLGASTSEAQLAVTLEAVDALLNYLVKDEISSAVNVTGLPKQLSARDKQYLDLARRMGIMLSKLCTGGIQEVNLTTHGESLQKLGGLLQKQVVADLLSPHFSTRLNLINVDEAAISRNIKVSHSADLAVSAITDSVSVKVKSRDGEHKIAGEIFLDGRPRIMAVDGYTMNLEPEGDMVMIFNEDQPGVIGTVGTILGDKGVNVADFMLSRREKKALMVIKLDSPMPTDVLETLRAKSPPIIQVLPVTLPAIEG
jgi:D-3-phosphoglycerate dehydrogenase